MPDAATEDRSSDWRVKRLFASYVAIYMEEAVGSQFKKINSAYLDIVHCWI